MKKILVILLSVTLLVFVSLATTTNYVNVNTGNDTNSGTLSLPWKTITMACTNANAPSSTVFIAAGQYNQNSETFPINVPEGINLIGAGFTKTFVTELVNVGPQLTLMTFNARTNSIVSGITFQNPFNGDSIFGVVFNSNSVATLQDCRITAVDVRNNGAGLVVNKSSPTIKNCIINGNHGSNLGTPAGIYINDGSPQFINCNIMGNANNGIYIKVGNVGSPLFRDCIIWRNYAAQVGATSTMFTNCIIDDNAMISGNSCTNTEPYLWGGYFLSSIAAGQANNSPCINAGSRTAAAAGLTNYTTQLNGTLDSGIVDIGFHYVGGTSGGTNYYVNVGTGNDSNAGTNSTTAFKTITKAMTVAQHGSVVNVAAGSYVFGVETFPILPADGVYLLGSSYTNCIIDLTGHSARCLNLNDLGWSQVQGFTIQNAGNTDGSGGVVSQYTMATFIACRVTGNNARQNGGGFYDTYSFNIYRSCLVDRNQSTGGGGGFYALSSTPNIYNCTIASNFLGGGISIGAFSSSAIINDIFWHNISELTGVTSNMISYSFIGDGAFNGTNNCITGNPWFINEFTGNYHLIGQSPCIRSGTNLPISVFNTLELDGYPRISYGGIVDMGVYAWRWLTFRTPSTTSSGLQLQISMNGTNAPYYQGTNCTFLPPNFVGNALTNTPAHQQAGYWLYAPAQPYGNNTQAMSSPFIVPAITTNLGNGTIQTPVISFTNSGGILPWYGGSGAWGFYNGSNNVTGIYSNLFGSGIFGRRDLCMNISNLTAGTYQLITHQRGGIPAVADAGNIAYQYGYCNLFIKDVTGTSSNLYLVPAEGHDAIDIGYALTINNFIVNSTTNTTIFDFRSGQRSVSPPPNIGISGIILRQLQPIRINYKP